MERPFVAKFRTRRPRPPGKDPCAPLKVSGTSKGDANHSQRSRGPVTPEARLTALAKRCVAEQGGGPRRAAGAAWAAGGRPSRAARRPAQ
eukprot:10191174-Alexandrium_andersonii.AAC.1